MIQSLRKHRAVTVYFGNALESGAIPPYFARPIDTILLPLAAVLKLNISVGREVSALRQIKSFKRRRKRSTQTKKRAQRGESEATRGFHLKKRVAGERKHLNRSALDTRSPRTFRHQRREWPDPPVVWWEIKEREGEDWNFNCVYFGPTRSSPSYRRSDVYGRDPNRPGGL